MRIILILAIISLSPGVVYVDTFHKLVGYECDNKTNNITVRVSSVSAMAPGKKSEYVIVMSKNDCLCQHMLKLYNSDIRNYGQVKYKHHQEFNWPKGEHKKISIAPPGYPIGSPFHQDAKIAFFDINNDSRDEAIVYKEGSVSGSPTDDYDVFSYGDIGMLNETVDGRVYYRKRLKGFSSSGNRGT